jgi:ribonuclease-3
LLADGFEAVIGALYLDQGLDAAATYLNTHLLHQVDEIVTLELYRDPKSRLQERVQGAGLASPYYQLLKAEGPDHERMFTMEVVIGTESMGSGVARSKQEAEQEAATQALEKLANLAYTTTSKSNNT